MQFNKKTPSTTYASSPFRNNKSRSCPQCEKDVAALDYKDPKTLHKYLSPRSKIIPRRISGLCPKHQKKLSHYVKISRFLASTANVFLEG